MCLLAAVTGLMIRAMPIDILAQIGFVVLVGLAAKNAILIVEFAAQAERDGADPVAAAVEAARLRLRPILMTSLAFRSEEHTSELQSLMRNSYAVFCLKKKKKQH